MDFNKWWNEIVRYPQYRGVQEIAQEAWDTATKTERERCLAIVKRMSLPMSSPELDVRSFGINTNILGKTND